VPELTFRDGMVLVGSLLILAVAVDAWRRMRQQKRDRVRMKLATDIPEAPVDELVQFRELPNGGARIVSRDELLGRSPRDDGDVDPFGKALRGSGAVSGGSPQARSNPRNPQQGVSSAQRDSSGTVQSAARQAGAADASRGAAAADRQRASDDRSRAAGDPDARPESSSDSSAYVSEDDSGPDSPLAGVSANSDEPSNLDWLEDLPEPDPVDEDRRHAGSSVDPEVIILHVVSREEFGFSGKDILEILLACDLRFGDMDFFHRHEQEAGRGPIQFSVANMLQPGVFDIDAMDSMRTRGLVFFLTLPGPEDMAQAFDYMLETARVVARNLGGELLDESRSVLTQQSVEHAKQQIRELERRMLAQSS
jgi:cell division protein ZipA